MAAQRPQNSDKRAYHRSGVSVVSKALPYLLERVADLSVPDEALSLIERGARDWRREVLADLGGFEKVSAARLALLHAATGTKIIMDSLDNYLFVLAAEGGLVNRRSRRAFSVVADRMRVADSLARQLQTLGLDRVPRKGTDLSTYISERYGATELDGRQAAPQASASPQPAGDTLQDAARTADDNQRRP